MADISTTGMAYKASHMYGDISSTDSYYQKNIIVFRNIVTQTPYITHNSIIDFLSGAFNALRAVSCKWTSSAQR